MTPEIKLSLITAIIVVGTLAAIPIAILLYDRWHPFFAYKRFGKIAIVLLLFNFVMLVLTTVRLQNG